MPAAVPWSLLRALRWPALAIPAPPRPRGGRPSRYTKATQQRLLNSLINDPRIHVAAQAAGVSRQTVRAWLVAHPGLRRAVAECRAHARRKRQLDPASRPPRKRPVPPLGTVPTKQMKVAAWMLARRTDPTRPLTEVDERIACARVRLDWTRWEQAKERFPALMSKVHLDRSQALVDDRSREGTVSIDAPAV